MPELKQCEFFLLRYLPDAVKGEFVNIGLVMLHEGSGFAQVRFAREWSRVRCLDPEADIEMLESIESELLREVTEVEGGGRERMLKRLRDTFSNAIEVSEPRACLAESPEQEADKLAKLYLESDRREQPRAKFMSARRRLVLNLRDAFEASGVLPLVAQKIAAAKYTGEGDPLKLDFGYGVNGSRPKTIKLFHAVVLTGDPDTAKVLCFSYPRLAEGVKRIEKAALELTAVVEGTPITDPVAQFSREALLATGIRVRPWQEIAGIAEEARRDLAIG